ncbi:biotin protein ligase [Metarhizium robertsii ARSEF 23]|uniref:Biotin protein ligase n=1 Tax=Metarhizium robertsii (strain ARSEF 23 / ATCC MYA-3075) TaxID=655844 RepID=E9EKN1_METRA|nr:biotin protein ligase [Metarhizium robertsii ARSEF 23]EFZ03105.1 biotin protein ligase [Metarhizium robertsii ARSEF 23]
MRNWPRVVMLAAAAWTGAAAAREFRALVYRGPAVCQNCPGALAQLLESSPQKVAVTYAGPGEKVKVTAESLRNVDVFATSSPVPHTDLDGAWAEIQDAAPAIRDFVSRGGRYMGVCLGAFLAGFSPGLGILPAGTDVDREIDQRRTQVANDSDTLIQVDWTFQSDAAGHARGQTVRDRWAYFQDGVAIKGLPGARRRARDRAGGDAVLARYSQSGDVAASRTPHGDGWVVLVGIHPEATSLWCKSGASRPLFPVLSCPVLPPPSRSGFGLQILIPDKRLEIAVFGLVIAAVASGLTPTPLRDYYE